MSKSIRAANHNGPATAAKVVRLERRPRLHRRDQEFLPAALEILETPPSPCAWYLFLLSARWRRARSLGVYWAYRCCCGSARQNPAYGRVKVIQPFESGRVRLIQAENGQHVSAGDVLVRLDSTEIHVRK